jgi:hypothetical protein
VNEVYRHTNKEGNRKRTNKRILRTVLSLLVLIVISLSYLAINIPPRQAFGGAIWFKHGAHYLNHSQLTELIDKIVAPEEAAAVNSIKNSTPMCDSVDSGYCQKSDGNYFIKTLIEPAVAYKPVIPSREELIGYCTVCNDGILSPSCATGSGACSWHHGIMAKNVPQYRTIPGTPEVLAREAVYSYNVKTYKDSPDYVSPDIPTFKEVASTIASR